MRKAWRLFLFGLLLTACPSTTVSTTSSSSTTGAGGASSSSTHTGTHTSSSGTGTGARDAGSDAPADAPSDVVEDYTPPPVPDGALAHPCTLPGAVQFTTTGKTTVPGGAPQWPDLQFLHLPAGFCAHYYATVGNARQMRFAPGGELFVASPTAPTTGGGANGQSAYVVVPDYNMDGVGDSIATYVSFGTGSMNQGMLFTGGYFYYQDGTPPGTKIMRVPYTSGDLKPSGTPVQVADINFYTSGLHWPKVMDVADDGTIYVGNGGDQGESCVSLHPFHGGIVKIDAAPGGPNPNGVQIAKGFRNPIGVRCARGHNTCFSLELALDYSAGSGGREKMVLIRQGDDWGFPCCATQNLAYPGVPFTNCSGVSAETVSFLIGDTPFGLDFEPGNWPAPYKGSGFIATHGAAGSWGGTRVVAVVMDPSTGLPVPSSNKNGMGDTGGMSDFATGWDDGSLSHGRAAAVTFAPDGRLFVANDANGVIFWIAPMN
jgi:glucose/arabinose dehydrogenase